MTAQELEIAIREHEMQRLELKESFNVECIETACAFANASGGYIVLGVDNNGNPAKAQLRFEALRDYENRIATATEPSVSVDAEKVAFRDATVVVLKVPENPLKPVAQVFYDMHLIEHYGSGTRRIKDECLKNGNKLPRWSQQYGSFITVYDSRLKEDEPVNEPLNGSSDPIHGTINKRHEVVNGANEVVNEVVSGRREVVNEAVNEVVKKVLEAIKTKPGIKKPELQKITGKSHATIERSVDLLKKLSEIEYRGSDKTGGYYAVK